MRIEYEITEQDFVSASLLATFKRSRSSIDFLALLPILGGVLIVVSIAVSIALGRYASMRPLFACGALLFIIPILARLRFRGVYRKTLILHDRQGFDADDFTVRLWSVTLDALTTWQSFTGFAEDRTAFVLFQRGTKIFILIPKRALTPPQVVELRTLLESHLQLK